MNFTQFFHFLYLGYCFVISQVLAKFCPPGLPCHPKNPPALPVISNVVTTTSSVLTTPNQTNDKSWNINHPSDVATNCINAMGVSIDNYCTDKANSDWDPSKWNTSTVTNRENCCSLFDEMDCYVQNSNTFCPKSTKDMVVAYAQRLALYITASQCPQIQFASWKSKCYNASTNKTRNDNSTKLPDYDFIHLPSPTSVKEKSCFAKLRSSDNSEKFNHSKINLEKKCHQMALNKWDPHRKRIVNSKAYCCAVYSTLNCLTVQSKLVCSSNEQKEMVNFRKNTTTYMLKTRCSNLPYEKSAHVCGSQKGSSGGHFNNSKFAWIILLLSSLLIIIN